MKPYIILILLVAVTFANSIQNSFIWDDRQLIEENPNINLPLREMPSIFIMPLWKFAGKQEAYQSYYRPVISLLNVLNYKIWGPNPFGFHLTNILLHLISAIVLYRIGLTLFNNDKLISFVGASIFAVHPVNNEPVARVGGGDAIFGFLAILSIYLFLKDKRRLSLLTFFLALLSKESAVMIPFALVILAVRKNGLKKGMITIMPYMILIIMYFTLRAVFADTVIGGGITQPILTQILTMSAAAFDYVRLLIIPYHLKPFYPAMWHTSIFEPKVIIAIITLISISLIALRIRKDKAMFFLLASAFIMLLPVILRVNTFPLEAESVYIAERFLYVPAMLFSLFLSAFVLKFAAEAKRGCFAMGWMLVIIIFAVIAISTNRIWKNDIAFFEKIAEDYPRASFVHKNLALAYYHSGQLDKAIERFQIELRFRPDNKEVRNSLGSIYYEQGKVNEAIREYLNAIKLFPDFAEAHYNLALALEKVGRKDEAIKEYLIALRLNPELQRHINIQKR